MQENRKDIGIIFLLLIGGKKLETTRNISTIHHSDKFICEKCGLILENWHRTVYTDDGFEYYQEYIFKFCPNCGRKVEE